MITVDVLASAIARRLGRSPEAARADAIRILNYFGFRTRIIDNAIHPEDRKLFYELHDAGLLQSTWEAVLLMNGRSWRIFYWELHEADLTRSAPEGSAEETPLYKRLPAEAWGRASTAT
jgi:hypothetical protein